MSLHDNDLYNKYSKLGHYQKIEKGAVASTVKIEISKSANLTSMITKKAVEELNLKEGDKVEAVIKATEIMISKD